MLNILIVEDDINIASGLVQLMQLEGYQAQAVHDGRAGLDTYVSGQFDLLIIDIMMPIMDGYELCKRIRSRDQKTPIIILSAKSDEIDKVVGLELGADDFVSKPFGAREIIARIHAITRRMSSQESITQPKPTTNEVFNLLDLKIDPASNRGYRNEIAIELSSRDIKILTLFKQNNGKVITRDKISDYAWGHDYIFNSRAIDQHIFQLRKRIEIDPQNPQIIKTVHGEGFRYER